MCKNKGITTCDCRGTAWNKVLRCNLLEENILGAYENEDTCTCNTLTKSNALHTSVDTYHTCIINS